MVVVASDQWVNVVKGSGRKDLEVDQTIAGAYTFPLFLPGGILSGTASRSITGIEERVVFPVASGSRGNHPPDQVFSTQSIRIL